MTAPIHASARDWFRVRPLEHGITHIDELHIVPFYRCNIWHVRGRDRDLLLDSGMGVVSLWRRCRGALDARCSRSPVMPISTTSATITSSATARATRPKRTFSPSRVATGIWPTTSP